jgi:hypothetical protein
MTNFNHGRWMVCYAVIGRLRAVAQEGLKLSDLRTAFEKIWSHGPVSRQKVIVPTE